VTEVLIERTSLQDFPKKSTRRRLRTPDLYVILMSVAIINASWRNSHPQITRRFIPAHKENEHEAGCTKKFAQAQETKEAPCYEEVRGGEEIKGGGSVKIQD
jgi:hypothetical protein